MMSAIRRIPHLVKELDNWRSSYCQQETTIVVVSSTSMGRPVMEYAKEFIRLLQENVCTLILHSSYVGDEEAEQILSQVG